MVTIDELVSGIQDIGFFDFCEIIDMIHSIGPQMVDRNLNEIQRNLYRLECLINIVTRKVPIDEFFSEDPKLALQHFKLELVKFKLDINVLKKNFKMLMEDYTCYTSLKRIFDKNILIIENKPEFKEKFKLYGPSDPSIGFMFSIEGALKNLGFGFLEEAEENLIRELNSLRRFANLPEINLLTDNFESLAIYSSEDNSFISQ